MTDGFEVTPQHLIWYQEEGTTLSLVATEDSEFVVLSGQPILEPIVNYRSVCNEYSRRDW